MSNRSVFLIWRQPRSRATPLRVAAWVVVIGLCRPLASLPASDSEAAFVQGLLDRGLVQVAEHEALRQLNDALLEPDERVTWSIRLAQAFARHAEELGGDDGNALATRAERTLSDLLAVQPPLPRREEARTQLVLLRARRVVAHAAWQSVLGDSDLTPSGDPAVAAVVQELRDQHAQLDKRIAAGSDRTPSPPEAAELSPGELRRLQREVDLQLATGLVTWIASASDGANRTAVATEADRLLQSLAGGWVGDLTTWEARLLRVKLARLRGETDHVVGLVQAAIQDQPAAWLVDRFAAEHARTLLDAGRLDVALDALRTHMRSRTPPVGELNAVLVSALVRSRRLAEQRADQVTADALWQQAEAVAAATSGAWGTAALRILTRERDAARYGDDVARLVHAAQRAYQTSDLDASLRLFQQAAGLAVTTGRPLAADELDYTRGSILVKAERFAEADDVLARLTARSPYGPHTQDGDLLRAYALGKLAVGEPTPARQDAYSAALKAHRERYPQSPTAAEATAMLAAWHESRGQWTAALALSLSLVDNSTHGPAAQVRVTTLYEHLLATLREQSQPDDEWEDRAVEDVAAFVRGYPTAAEQRTLIQTDITLRLARLVIEHREHLYTEADRLLTTALSAVEHQRRSAQRDGVPLSDDWAKLAWTARQWRIISLAGQGRMDEARQMFHDLAAADPRGLLPLLNGLSALAAVIPPQHRLELGRLQLEAAQQFRLQQPELTAAERLHLDAAIADAYLATGNVLNALAFYERLLEDAPGDRNRLRTAAELCQKTGEAANVRRAKSYWQRIEALEVKGSPAWLEARLNVAVCAVQLGRREEARKLIALTRLVYPELGGSALHARFNAVEKDASP